MYVFKSPNLFWGEQIIIHHKKKKTAFSRLWSPETLPAWAEMVGRPSWNIFRKRKNMDDYISWVIIIVNNNS